MFVSLEQVTGKTFDYVICGGGTAGLTLAARLTEDPAVSVLVLDAGRPNLDDPAILVPAQYGRQLGDERYDWMFWTTPQKYANNQKYLWSRGKSLGGSSAANFLVYSRPPVEDIDAWEKLGNPGWNWDSLLKYMKRGEKLTPPTEHQTAVFHQTYDPACHGMDGTLQVGFPSMIMDADLPVQETMNNVGIQTNKESLGGDVRGTWMGAATIDPVTKTRSYAATAFFAPFKDRSNYQVLMEAHVNKIIFSSELDGGLHRAEGVQFSHGDRTYEVKARREVILCSGAIKSPQILELSGVGVPDVLRAFDIPCIVPLPGVGNNVQEHMFYAIAFELDSTREGGWHTLDVLRHPELAEAEMKLFANQQGLHTLGISGFSFVPLQDISPSADQLVSGLADKLKQAREAGRISDSLWEQYEIQLRHLQSRKSVDVEIIAMPLCMVRTQPVEDGKAYMSILVALNHPFSRGSIHIASKDPQQQPLCDPHYFEEDFDLQLLVEGFKFVRRLENVEPFKSIIVKETSPGPSVQTDEAIRAYIIDCLTTTYHTASSCSMLPREKGGVVDPTLKVYGTSNVRVVDLSVVPLHMAAHTQASVYGIAERAADIIKGKI